MKTRKIPMRMCVGCRQMKDPTGKKSGRGAYVCRRGDCLQRAIRQRQLERQLDHPLTDEVVAALQLELEKLGPEETDG